MSHRVDTLTVRCRAGSDARQEVERVRSRLNRIAERHLSPALDALLPDGDAVIETIVAPLDFELAAYDDETVAWRWAQAIAVAVANAVPSPPTGQRVVDDPENTALTVHRSRTAREALVVALEAVVENDRSVEPSLSTVLDRLPPMLRVAVGRSIDAWSAAIAGQLERLQEAPPDGRPPVPPSPAPEHHVVTSEPRSGPEAPGRPSPEPTTAALVRRISEATPAEVSQLIDLIRVESDSSEAVVRATAPAGAATAIGLPQTRAAGLCLLYPWIGRLVERSWILHGDGPEVAAAALMALAPNLEPSLMINDPLVKVLAGVTPEIPLDVDRCLAFDRGPLAEDVAEIHTRFVTSLRGAWAVETVLEQLVVRDGNVEDSGGVWTVVPRRRPLDFLLETLPYPLGSFALPWTDPVSVRWPHE